MKKLKNTCESCGKELPEDDFPRWVIRFCDDCMDNDYMDDN